MEPRINSSLLLSNKMLINLYRLLADHPETISAADILLIINHDDFQLLIDEKGAEFIIPDIEFEPYHDHCFETPLIALSHVASQHNQIISDDEMMEIIERLVHLGADINAMDDAQNTAIMHLAATTPDRSNFLYSIKLLESYGANLNAVNNQHQNVLFRAFELDNYELALALYEKGAKVIFDKNNCSFLIECKSKTAEELLQYFHSLVSNLRAHHLLSFTNVDHLYKKIKKAGDENDVIPLFHTNAAITEKTIKLTLEKFPDQFRIIHALFEALDQKLHRIYELQPTLSTTIPKKPSFFQTKHERLSSINLHDEPKKKKKIE